MDLSGRIRIVEQAVEIDVLTALIVAVLTTVAGWLGHWVFVRYRAMNGQTMGGVVPALSEDVISARADASKLFNPEFVDIPGNVRAEAIESRIPVHTAEIQGAWRTGGWKMPLVPLIGASAIVVDRRQFEAALPHLGTSKVAYSAKRNWVCREYGFVFAAIVAAELQCNVGIVCDVDSEHLYSMVPVHNGGKVEILIIEPQTDSVVTHTDAAHHYSGDPVGFALLI